MITNHLDGARLCVGLTSGFLICLIVYVWIHYIALRIKGYKIDAALPWHIILITISYVSAISYIFFNTISRVGLPISWHLFLAIIMIITGIPALLFMMKHLDAIDKRIK